MSQQINLYRPALFEKSVPFSSRIMGAVLVGFLLLALLLYGLARWREDTLRDNLAQLEARQSAAVARIDALRRKYPPRSPDAQLAQHIARLTEERQARLALLDHLTRRRPGNTQGFSRHLEGLAREDLAETWLRRIRLSGGGRNLELEGSTTQASKVPVYLQRLTHQEEFAGREFDRLQLSRSEERPGVIDFLLQTTVEEQP